MYTSPRKASESMWNTKVQWVWVRQNRLESGLTRGKDPRNPLIDAQISPESFQQQFSVLELFLDMHEWASQISQLSETF